MFVTIRRVALWLPSAALSLYLTGCASMQPLAADGAVFNWFEYRGEDAIFEEPLTEGQFQNPILAGFYPDPSIARAGEDFYLVHSSFSYYPGVPIFQSTDLVNWRSLGHVLTRPEQLNLQEAGVSRGIFAPTIRHHNGTFYVITTLVDSGGNFLVTATDPAGPWSDPIWLPELDGIDPDIFFDDNGRVYIAHNGPPLGEPLYDGHRAIWLWEYNPETEQVIPGSGRIIVNGGTDLTQEPVWIEAPHLFKKDDWYYLSCAEGGTGYEHSQVIFRTRSLEQPFVPYVNNPILTQRDLDIDRPSPITTAGHADMIQTPAGEWWAVFLATRAYDKTFYNTGRETFLLPVHWESDWPHILPAGEAIPYRLQKPAGLPPTPKAEPTTGNFVWRDEFEQNERSPRWSLLRTGADDWYIFNSPPGSLTIQARPIDLTEQQRPAVLMYSQKHTSFHAKTELELPLPERTSAGLTVFQNETHHYYLGVERSGDGYAIFLQQAKGGPRQRLESAKLADYSDAVVLGAEGTADAISFYYATGGGDRTYLGHNLDARMLSTEVAGGFVGAHIGLHAKQDEK